MKIVKKEPKVLSVSLLIGGCVILPLSGALAWTVLYLGTFVLPFLIVAGAVALHGLLCIVMFLRDNFAVVFTTAEEQSALMDAEEEIVQKLCP